MPSMPQPIPDDQDDTSKAEEIVLGVDTQRTDTPRRCSARWVCCSAATIFPPPQRDIGRCWPGRARSGYCDGLVWRAPAPTARCWPAPCGQPGLR